MPSSATILVTDGEHRAALAVTRSLGRAGYRVVVAATRAHSLAGSSRYASDRALISDPLKDPQAFFSSIAEICSRIRPDLLIPITDQSIAPVLDRRNELNGVVVPFPSADVWRRISDKTDLTRTARELGLMVPVQSLVVDRNATGFEGHLRFPVVVKPGRSLNLQGSRPVKLSVRHVADFGGLKEVLQALPEAAFPLLVQERIVGPGIGVFLLRWNGRLLATFGHRRILEKPPSGGVSVCSESVEVTGALRKHSLDLLEAYSWNGVAMVEFKRDRSTGTPYLMEINGRFWGSLQLAVDSGVDFPTLLAGAALGRSVEPVTGWRVGVRSSWRLGLVDHLLARIRRTGASLPSDLPSLTAVLGHVVRPPWGADHRAEIFRLDDPLPALREFTEWIQGR